MGVPENEVFIHALHEEIKVVLSLERMCRDLVCYSEYKLLCVIHGDDSDRDNSESNDIDEY